VKTIVLALMFSFVAATAAAQQIDFRSNGVSFVGQKSIPPSVAAPVAAKQGADERKALEKALAEAKRTDPSKWDVCKLGAAPIAPGPAPRNAVVFKTEGGPVLMSERGPGMSGIFTTCRLAPGSEVYRPADGTLRDLPSNQPFWPIGWDLDTTPATTTPLTPEPIDWDKLKEIVVEAVKNMPAPKVTVNVSPTPVTVNVPPLAPTKPGRFWTSFKRPGPYIIIGGGILGGYGISRMSGSPVPQPLGPVERTCGTQACR
jgi:hypothetical protein